jgi:hypothetical protein
VHIAPPVPHEVLVSLPSAMHAPPAQQPVHLLASQTQAPATQLCPAAHAAQVAPPCPHAWLDAVTHEPLVGSQQPWQLAGPHEQVPVAAWQ